MVIRSLVRSRTYRDSVKLMGLSAMAKSLPGIDQAVAIMGTERNKAVLDGGGLLVDDARAAHPDDLVAVVRGENEEAVRTALTRLEEMLAEEDTGAGQAAGREYFPRSIGSALRQMPAANLALISVPGPYAAAEAAKALRLGLHVHIFSDHVSLEEECELKRLGRERGLLVMGPDCGTSIINGIPLAFANVVGRGPIGIVGASGTGIQQISVLIDRLGSGITHAIGTGGRDLSDPVGGITTLMGLEALEDDPATSVIVVVSKPPGMKTAKTILDRIKICPKPVVVCFMGWDPGVAEPAGAFGASTLEEAAGMAVALAKHKTPGDMATFPRGDLRRTVVTEAGPKQRCQRYLRGLYTGGTLAEEAMRVLEKQLGAIHSNIPYRAEFKLSSSLHSVAHSVIDLGDDEFTQGRPHPMIDPTLRAERLRIETGDPEVAVLLCDVVIGYGSHPDPAGALAGAVRQARAMADRHLTVVASVCGTDGDPQNLERQEETLRREGILVFPSNAFAAAVAGAITSECAERGVR